MSSRPAAITAAAVVAVVGSIVAVLFAVLFVYVTFSPDMQSVRGKQPNPAFVTGVMIGAAAVILACAGWGIATAVGLFRLRNWARLSLLVFAGLLAVGTLMSGIAVLALPTGAAQVPPQALRATRMVLAFMYGVPFLIAVWWLVQFNQASTKAVFANADPGAMDDGRPLSISIIGYFLAIGGGFCVIPVLVSFPAYFGGAVVTGWSARLVYAIIGAAELYAGIGLLHLRERGRLAAIGVCCLAPLNALALMIVPGAYDKMLTLERARFSGFAAADSAAPHLMMARWSATLGIVGALIPLWFLVRRKAAFQKAG